MKILGSVTGPVGGGHREPRGENHTGFPCAEPGANPLVSKKTRDGRTARFLVG
jgi:hypothetical protein